MSAAVGHGATVLATRALPQERSSTQLLALVAEALAAAGAHPADLAGIVALAGPGSFTGLRVALATALGLHQALGVPARTVPTLAALAASAASAAGATAPAADPANPGAGPAAAAGAVEPPAADPAPPGMACAAWPAGSGGGLVLAAVDALRGEWSAQLFRAGPLPQPLGEMTLLPAGGLLRLLPGTAPSPGEPGAAGEHHAMARIAEMAETLGPLDLAGTAGIGRAVQAAETGQALQTVQIIAFGVATLRAALGGTATAAALRYCEAPPLAPAALRLAAAAPLATWQPATLAAPIYSRPPATTLPRRTALIQPPAGPGHGAHGGPERPPDGIGADGGGAATSRARR